MEQKISNKNGMAFYQLMRRQGYSGKYIPFSRKHIATDLPVELKGYLRKFLVGYWPCKSTLHLAIKLNRTPHVRCVFTVGFEEAEGFRAKKYTCAMRHFI